MGTLTIDYGTAAPIDVAQLAALYQEFYPNLAWTESYLRWQYFENPAGRAQIWVAKDSDKIVATYVAVPHQVSMDGKIGMGWRIQDVLTRPEYRGRGIYHALSKIATEYLSKPEFLLSFAFPKDRSTSHNGFIRSGWRSAFEVPLKLLRGVEQMGRQAVQAEVTPLPLFDVLTDRIWQSCAQKIRYAVHRTCQYLNWRYLSNPKGKYFPFRLTMGGDELILILKEYNREDGTRWAHICDLFQEKGHLELTESAVSHCINFALSLGCQSLSCWTPVGSPLSLVLERCSFTNLKEQRWWVVIKAGSSQDSGVSYCDEKDWHLSMGDSDVF